MPASPSAPTSSPLGRVHLITGSEEFIRERAVTAARDAVHRVDPESEQTETTGDQLSAGELEALTAPSLFSSVRCVVVRNLEDTPETSFDAVLEFADAPPEDVALVLVHSGGQKGTGLLTKLRKSSGVSETKVESLKPSDFPRFVAGEVRRHGASIDEDATEFLVTAVGQDLRALSGAAHQLAADFPDTRLTSEIVGRYFAGRAEVKSFVIADHALFGRTSQALEELRWALETGVAVPLITGSFAMSVRGLAKVKSGDTSGVPGWKLRTLRDQARGWDERGLARAVVAVARADAEVKGAGSDPAYALERMVLTICTARSR